MWDGRDFIGEKVLETARVKRRETVRDVGVTTIVTKNNNVTRVRGALAHIVLDTALGSVHLH